MKEPQISTNQAPDTFNADGTSPTSSAETDGEPTASSPPKSPSPSALMLRSSGIRGTDSFPSSSSYLLMKTTLRQHIAKVQRTPVYIRE